MLGSGTYVSAMFYFGNNWVFISDKDFRGRDLCIDHSFKRKQFLPCLKNSNFLHQIYISKTFFQGYNLMLSWFFSEKRIINGKWIFDEHFYRSNSINFKTWQNSHIIIKRNNRKINKTDARTVYRQRLSFELKCLLVYWPAFAFAYCNFEQNIQGR